MKKLLIISDSFLPRWDGVARFLAEMIPRLLNSYEITVIVPDFPGDYEAPETFTIVRVALSRYSINDFPLARRAKTIIRKHVNEADIVWIHDLSVLGIQGIFAAKKFQKPLVAFNHVIEWEIVNKSVPGPWFIKNICGKVAKITSRLLYNKCDVLMVPSKDVSYKLINNSISANKVLVPLGVDTDKFIPPKSKAEAKLALDIPADSFVVGYVGRLGREKDLPTLFKSFLYLHKLNRSATLLIVGKGVLEDDDIKLNPRVIFAGQQENVIPFYQAMDVFVLPSLTETTSLSTLEAMACGLPVITTPLGCLQSFIENNKNGLFFPKRNYLVLRKKLLHLMNSNNVRAALGFEARFTVEQRFSWEYTVQLAKDVLAQF